MKCMWVIKSLSISFFNQEENVMSKKFVMGAALIVSSLVATPVFAQEHYAVTCISTATDTTVHFFYRYGNNEWKLIEVSPGESHYMSWEYDYANQNRSPQLQIRYNDIPDTQHFTTYNVKGYASSSQNCVEGKQYEFYFLNGAIMLREVD